MRGVYTSSIEISGLSSAKTVLLIQSAATAVIEILSVKITNVDSEVSEQLKVGFYNVTTYGTPAGTAITAEKHESLDAAASCTCLGNLSGEPTAYASKPVDEQGVNSLSGYFYDPIPEERPIIGPGKAAGVRVLNAPSNPFNCNVQVVFREIG